jgi:hypothetical protein
MATINLYFEQLLKNLQPPDDRIEAARTLPPLIRDYLKRCADFPTLEPHTRLAGSYAQDMSTSDVKDVDILVRLDGNPAQNEPIAKQVISQLYYTLNKLTTLPTALGEDWQVTQVAAELEMERARRSVHVYFKNHDFHLDLVPCMAPDGFDEPLYVPDRGYNEWVESHPLGYVALLNDLNNKYAGKVKKLGKLLKHFRNYQMQTRKPKSYWLGAMLVDHIQNGNLDMTQPLPVLFRDLLNSIYNQFAATLGREGHVPHIKDPMLGHDVSPSWQRTHFETFMRRVDEGRTWATQALADWEAGLGGEAILGWQRIFGDEAEGYFPSKLDQEFVKSRAAIGLPGESFVDSHGQLMSNRPTTGLFTPVKSTRFYGYDQE